jgi:hypothetical protein
MEITLTDIVVRLRNLGWETCHEAAAEIERLGALATVVREQGVKVLDLCDEIERLREHIAALQLVATAHEPEVERLRAALQEIACNKVASRAKLEAIARRALEPKS